MNIIRYFINNFTMFFELVGLLIVLGISVHISERTKKLTRIVVALLLAESLSCFFERWSQTFQELSLIRPILTACIYSLYPLILFFVMQLMRAEKQSRKKSLLLLIPEIISIPIYFTSQWTHLVCWFSPSNHFHGGPLRFLPYVLFCLYSLFFLFQNLVYFKGYSKRERVLSAYIVLTPLIGVLCNLVFEIDNDYSALFTSGILLYFISLYIHMAKTDPLTVLFNRQSYYQDLKHDEKMITAVVSVDMNELKYINDCSGHQAGDNALKAIAVILRENCGFGGTVYRVGGDEFIILYYGVGEAQITNAVAAMRKKLAETSYSCAFGYAMAQQGTPINETVIEADKKMYEDKNNIKSAMLARGEILHERKK